MIMFKLSQAVNYCFCLSPDRPAGGKRNWINGHLKTGTKEDSELGSPDLFLSAM
jgi:hypothetical protein